LGGDIHEVMDFVIRVGLKLLEVNFILITLLVAIIMIFDDNDKGQG
jgi:uncharacterized membrane protein YqjE